VKLYRSTLFLGLCLVLVSGLFAQEPEIKLERDDSSGRLAILIDGRTALVYQYAENLDLPHYWPMNSPSGKNMLVQKTEPYPHHRSFWFADTIRLNKGREVSTYNALYSGQKKGDTGYEPPFKDRVSHLEFTRCEVKGGRAVVEATLVWEMDKNIPLLDEDRQLVVNALGRGEYFLELILTLTAAHGDVEFVSDAVHYAWPYLRLQTRFSGENGGTIVSDNGAIGQEATNEKVALWMDYFNTVEGVTEGVAIFQMPDGLEHRWLTREYGCFGPRRPDKISGNSFILKKGESITQRVGILVHRGDVKTGLVAERYRHYIKSNLR